MPSNFEKYLANEPLNEQNAKVRRGELPEWEPPTGALAAGLGAAEQRGPLLDAERPLMADERAALREMRQGPGWAVLQRLLERATITHQKSAILLSQDDPAAHRDEIAQAWLTVKVWKAVVAGLNLAVELELREQQAQAKQDADWEKLNGHETESAE
jgi:hypothetical protein